MKIVKGKRYVATIDVNQPWVEYSPNNDDDESIVDMNYYRDVFINGHLVYCDGESCECVGFDEGMVFLRNTDVDMYFKISREQFEADFSESI